MASRTVKPKAGTVDDDLLANGLARYHLEPPSWRAPWLANKPNSGYPQFYPTCDGQDEDLLTDSAVKTGFSGKSIVQVRLPSACSRARGGQSAHACSYPQTESFSAHQLIYDKLKSDSILPALSRLATAVAERAQGRIPSYGSACTQPGRAGAKELTVASTQTSSLPPPVSSDRE